MVIQRNQAVENLKKAFDRDFSSVTRIIDRKLIDLYAGDIASISLTELGFFPPILSDALCHKVIEEIIKIYKSAGWEVDLIQDNGIDPHFTFK